MKVVINPTVQKISIWLALLIVAVIAFNMILKAIKSAQAAADANAVRNDLNPAGLSYPVTQYSVLADKAETAIGPISIDHETLYSVFNQMQTVDDVKQLIKSFGSRKIEFFTPAQTLAAALSDWASSSTIAAVNKILSDKNINFSF